MFKKLCLLLIINYSALADELSQATNIAASAMRVQAERLKIISENIANKDSTASTPGGKPYLRKTAIVKNKIDPKTKQPVLTIEKIHEEDSFILKYDPHHPAADEKGYVKMPHISPHIEKVDSMQAQRAYEANLAVIETTKAMKQKTMELLN